MAALLSLMDAFWGAHRAPSLHSPWSPHHPVLGGARVCFYPVAAVKVRRKLQSFGQKQQHEVSEDCLFFHMTQYPLTARNYSSAH